MALREWCNRFGAADPNNNNNNNKRHNNSTNINNREPKVKRPRLQNKPDTKKIWGAKSLSPEVKDGPKVTVVPRIEHPMKIPRIEPPIKIPRIEPPRNNKDEDVKPFICTSCKKSFNNKACQTM